MSADIKPLRDRVREFRFNTIAESVARLGSVYRAALELGIHRNAIYREFRLSGSRLTIAKLKSQRRLKVRATKTQHS